MITLSHHSIYACLILLGTLCAGCGAEQSQAPPESEIKVTGVAATKSTDSQVKAEQQVREKKPEGAVPQISPDTTSDMPDVKKTEQQQDSVIYRPSDQRPVHNDQRLALLGIHCYESPRLKLYTDIDPEVAQKLPAVIDEAYPALVDYFGPLPPNREGTDFQVTGYIMQNRELFKKAGVILESLPEIVNGRHQGAQFWMDAQSQEYYLRHLMLHEYTHCFSMIMEDIGAPVWYLEGIAESMATHRRDRDGKLQLNVMPHNKNDFGGLGRISLIQEAILKEPPPSIFILMQFTPNDFVDTNSSYAWSWALCQFFDKHPHYQSAFRELVHEMQGTGFSLKMRDMFGKNHAEINDAWMLFITNLQPGYDSKRAMIDFLPGKELVPGRSAATNIVSDRGWQSSGVHVTRGETYAVDAAGTFALAQEPKPWTSTADGITFQYFKGQPLGRLMMMIRPDVDSGRARIPSLLREYPQGTEAVWMAPVSGTIYFRLNDAWDSLADNQGSVKVTVTRKP